MLGAIIGDIAGSVYEFNNIKTTKFDLMGKYTYFTDDTVMTCAVAKGLLEGYGSEAESRERVVEAMQLLGRQYPSAGYGGNFNSWIWSDSPQPYNSWGNGSAMRTSAAGWLYHTLEDVERYAKVSAEVTHDHPEGIKGAQAVAAAIFMARTGSTKAEIRVHVEESYGYDLSLTCDDIRPTYTFDVSCQGTVPQAFAAFFEGKTFEEVIRLAVSLGGDSDTLAAIAGSMAEALYKIPRSLKRKALAKLDDTLREILRNIEEFDGCVEEGLSEGDALERWSLGLGSSAKVLAGEDPLPSKRTIALKSSWERSDMPHDLNETIELNLPITEEELKCLAMGHIPEVMEDHWFMYFDGECINYHRSWTGYCLYKATVQRTFEGLFISHVVVNRNPDVYTCTDAEKDKNIFLMLIASELGRDAEEYWMRIERSCLGD